VDFGWVAVGPVLSSLLAEFGAEVIKVESSRRLDYCRLIPTPIREDERVSEALETRAAEVDRVPLFHQYNPSGVRGAQVGRGDPLKQTLRAWGFFLPRPVPSAIMNA